MADKTTSPQVCFDSVVLRRVMQEVWSAMDNKHLTMGDLVIAVQSIEGRGTKPLATLLGLFGPAIIAEGAESMVLESIVLSKSLLAYRLAEHILADHVRQPERVVGAALSGGIPPRLVDAVLARFADKVDADQHEKLICNTISEANTAKMYRLAMDHFGKNRDRLNAGLVFEKAVLENSMACYRAVSADFGDKLTGPGLELVLKESERFALAGRRLNAGIVADVKQRLEQHKSRADA